METLEQLRSHLSSVDDLHGIVRTMKSLAAVSIRHHEQAVASLSGYFRTVELGLHAVLRDLPRVGPPREASASGVAAVVFGSDHGLCGRFNEDIAGFARDWLGAREELSTRVLVVGARVAATLEAAGVELEEEMPMPRSGAHATPLVHDILLKIDDWRREGIGQVHLFHNRPVSQTRHEPIGHRLLPIDLSRFHRLRGEPWPSRRRPMFTMERDALLSALLRHHVFVALFRSCIESLAAENASRLAAMRSAERSLEDRREELLADLSRRRQGAITTELMDVVSGYEALSEPEPGGGS